MNKVLLCDNKNNYNKTLHLDGIGKIKNESYNPVEKGLDKDIKATLKV